MTAEHLFFGLFSLLLFASGVLLGVGEVAPWLHRREMRRLMRVPLPKVKQPKSERPVTTIVPLMSVLDGSGERWRRLELPAVTRRRKERG